MQKRLIDITNSFLKFISFCLASDFFQNNKKKFALIFIIFLSVICFLFSLNKYSGITITENDGFNLISLPIAETQSKIGVINVPSGIVKANPFIPCGEIQQEINTKALDVPAYTLTPPPEFVNDNSEGARVMDTVVSGILYDKYSPSAILNIEGNDYLVKKGDVVNNYKVINITVDTVTVKLGTNTFSAGIGEILTEGTVNRNNVANLNNKFGGRK